MKKIAFSITKQDPEMWELIRKTDQKTLAIWAIDCALRALPYFEQNYPKDNRPKKAIETLKYWIETGKFNMPIIRKASLNAHAAAREVGEESPARSAARACGQAVATAHVKTHAYGPAIYSQQAIFRATNSLEEVNKERDWQFNLLLELRKT